MSLLELGRLVNEKSYKLYVLVDGEYQLDQEIKNYYYENESSLKKDFFKAWEECSINNDWLGLHDLVHFLILDTLKPEEHSIIQASVLKSIDILINAPKPPKEHLNFLWSILDIMLHYWIISDEKELYEHLQRLTNHLPCLRSLYTEETDLLAQKIEHFIGD